MHSTVNYPENLFDQIREIFMPRHSGPENLKKSRPKKLVKSNKSISRKIFSPKSSIAKQIFHEIAFLAVLNFFPVQKLIFGHF